MSNKIRLVGGPLGGKIINHPRPGESRIVVSGPKRMSRKKRYEAMQANFASDQYYGQPLREPVVRAEYEIALVNHLTWSSINRVPCMHPDGSLFYTYVKGSERAY